MTSAGGFRHPGQNRSAQPATTTATPPGSPLKLHLNLPASARRAQKSLVPFSSGEYRYRYVITPEYARRERNWTLELSIFICQRYFICRGPLVSGTLMEPSKKQGNFEDPSRRESYSLQDCRSTICLRKIVKLAKKIHCKLPIQKFELLAECYSRRPLSLSILSHPRIPS